ncbi:thioredoxin O2, mitochondrial-like [Macadamia integrifolia]|uniref:thioredoxin O2, mitochondrial-like n=1 Tax=Macadamia integrifolia TaxID=60698 RepID=UPI001C527B35|nr:thioredoxin O2, mitochondrial-like [Macadamia integrifolia]
MARNSLLRPSVFRSLLCHQRPSPTQAFSSNPSFHSFPNYFPTNPDTVSPPLPSKSSSSIDTSRQFSNFHRPCRSFSSSTGPSNIVVVKSPEEFSNSFQKVQDDRLPAILYFTATWCGPCKLISPVIEELSKKFPHVTTYKIDIDIEGLGDALSKLKIYSVPTFYFFQNGTKATEVIGADTASLKATMEDLYKKE